MMNMRIGYLGPHNFYYTYNTVGGSLEASEPPKELTFPQAIVNGTEANTWVVPLDEANKHSFQIQEPKLSFNPILWQQIQDLIREEISRQLQQKEQQDV